MIIKVTTILCFVLAHTILLAQTEAGPIQPDRPGLGESSQIVPEHYFQIETGMNLEYNQEASVKTKSISWNNLTMRWGIFDAFELRFAINLEQEYTNGLKAPLELSPFSLGFKARVTAQKGLIPSTAVLGNLGVPYLLADTVRPQLNPSILIPMEWDLSESLLLTLNNGLFWNGIDAVPEYFASVGLDLELPKATGVFIESYVSLSDPSNFAPGLNGGFIWRAKPNLQFDCSAGVGLNSNIANGFINAGLSYRIPK